MVVYRGEVAVIGNKAVSDKDGEELPEGLEMGRRLEISVWYIAFYFYTFRGLFVYEVPEFEVLGRYLHLIIDLMLAGLGLRCIGKNTNGFIKVLLVLFLFTSTLSYAVNSGDLPILSHLNGMREYLVLFFAYTFANYAVEGRARNLFLKRFVRLAKTFLIVQIPAAFYLYARYGAGDMVGGTFGPGGSGLLTIAIFCWGFYLAAVHWNQGSSKAFSLRNNIKVLPLLFPTLINETKITFIFLVLFFTVQLKLTLKATIANAVLLGSMLVAVVVHDNYVASKMTSDVVFEETFLKKYLFGEYREGYDIPRGTKIRLTLETIGSEVSSLLFGEGIGLFKGGSVMEKSEYSAEFSWLTDGTRPYIFFLLLGGGLTNTVIILILLFYPLLKRGQSTATKMKESTPLKNLRYFMIAMLMAIILYNDALRVGTITMIIATLSMIVYNNRDNELSRGRTGPVLR